MTSNNLTFQKTELINFRNQHKTKTIKIRFLFLQVMEGNLVFDLHFQTKKINSKLTKFFVLNVNSQSKFTKEQFLLHYAKTKTKVQKKRKLILISSVHIINKENLYRSSLFARIKQKRCMEKSTKPMIDA